VFAIKETVCVIPEALAAKMRCSNPKISSAMPAIRAPHRRNTFLADIVRTKTRKRNQLERTSDHSWASLRASAGDASSSSNVEERKAGRSTYRPDSYNELVNDAVQSILLGIGDGLSRMEVEFPSVSGVDGE